jgi:hypothetical protein
METPPLRVNFSQIRDRPVADFNSCFYVCEKRSRSGYGIRSGFV